MSARLTHGSLFSGIGGFDLAADRVGLETRWQVENEPFCCRVLGKHWPQVRRYGDIRTVSGADLEPVDVVTGGFPCQGLSIAGRREGLADARSGLFFELIRVVRELREATHGRSPALLVLENVPGLLSSRRGRDFAVVLQALAELGPVGLAWRILDARWFGVAQRRRRVFVVADFGGRRAAQVLFEPQGRRRHPAAGRAAGASVAGTLAGCSAGGGWRVGPDEAAAGQLVSYALAGGGGPARLQHEQTYVPVLSSALTAEGHDASEDGSGRRALSTTRQGNEGLTGGVPFTVVNGNSTPGWCEDQALALRANDVTGNRQWVSGTGTVVRRLTPTECERLQGFEDGHSCLCGVMPYATSTCRCLDSNRYAAIGNAVAVPVAEWLLRRCAAAVREEQIP